MKSKMQMLIAQVHELLVNKAGQDLIEYALIFSLIALATTAGMLSIATALNTTFVTVGSIFTNAVN